MAVYDLTNVTNATDVLEFAQEMDSLSEDFLGIFMFLGLVMIIFGTLMLSSKQPVKSVLAATAWFSTFFAFFLVQLSLLPEIFLLGSGVFLAFTTIILVFRPD